MKHNPINLYSKITIIVLSASLIGVTTAYAGPQKGWIYVGSVSLEMHAQGYKPEGEYFIRQLSSTMDGTPRFMMQSLAIEGNPNSGKFIADCDGWRYKEYDLTDGEGNQLKTGWNSGYKGSGLTGDNALKIVCK